MLLLNPKEMKHLLYEETDIEIKSFGKSVVYLEYPPMDLSADAILYNGKDYYISTETLLQVLEDEVLSVKPIITYDEHGIPTLFIIE